MMHIKYRILFHFLLLALLFSACSSYTIKENKDMDVVSEKIRNEKKDLWINIETALQKPQPKNAPGLHLYILQSLGNIPDPKSGIILKRYFSDEDIQKREASLRSYWDLRAYNDETTIKEDLISAIEKNYYQYGLLSRTEIDLIFEMDLYQSYFILCQYSTALKNNEQKKEILVKIKTKDKSGWSNDQKQMFSNCIIELLDDDENIPKDESLRQEHWNTLLSINPAINENILISIIRDTQYNTTMRKEAILLLSETNPESSIAAVEYQKQLKSLKNSSSDDPYSAAMDERLKDLYASYQKSQNLRSISTRRPRARSAKPCSRDIERPSYKKLVPSVKNRNRLHAMLNKSHISNSVFFKMEKSARLRDNANIIYSTFVILYPKANYHTIRMKYENIFSHPYFFTTFMSVLRRRYPREDIQTAYLASLWNISSSDAKKLISFYKSRYRSLRYAGL